MERKVEWKLRDGRQATVTVALVTEERVWLDGHEDVVPCCRIDVVAMVDGVEIGRGEPVNCHVGVVMGRIGKLGMISRNLDKVNAAIAEVKQAPEWQAKVAKIAKAEREINEYDEHRARMRRAMGE